MFPDKLKDNAKIYGRRPVFLKNETHLLFQECKAKRQRNIGRIMTVDKYVKFLLEVDMENLNHGK